MGEDWQVPVSIVARSISSEAGLMRSMGWTMVLSDSKPERESCRFLCTAIHTGGTGGESDPENFKK